MKATSKATMACGRREVSFCGELVRLEKNIQEWRAKRKREPTGDEYLDGLGSWPDLGRRI